MRYLDVFLRSYSPLAHMRHAQAAIKSIAIFAFATFILHPTQAQAPIDLRVALVIGNSAYAGKAALTNPANDAAAMSETLRGMGFTVIESRDASKAQMLEAISKTTQALRGKQGIGMLYYAGHGLQLDWRNFMVPVDAKLSQAKDVPDQTVDLSLVIDAFKAAGNRMNIVVLDACRDNPFAGTASGKGLAQLDAPPGTFLAYATAPGNVADDGAGQNGLYTGFLLQELKKPQAKIEDVFKRVRLNVRQKSEGKQIPWESTSLEDDFFFNAGLKPTQKLGDSEKARLFNAEKADWDAIKSSSNVADYYAFLQKYPHGNTSAAAQGRIEELQRGQIKLVADQSGLVASNMLDVYKPGDRYVFRIKDGLTNVTRGQAGITLAARADGGIDGISDNLSLHGSAQLTKSGLIANDGSGSYDPPWSLYPNGELKIGSKATTRSIVTHNNGFKQWVEVESRVVGKEKIDTDLGPLLTIRVEAEIVFQNGNRTKSLFWFDPQWGYAIKVQRESRSARGGAPSIWVREIVSRSRAS
jgi:Caspase domain